MAAQGVGSAVAVRSRRLSGDPVPMVALSRFDGQRAVDDIRALRALLEASRESAAKQPV